MRPDAPTKNYIDCEQKTNYKICIIAMLCSTLIIVKSTLNDSINVKVLIFGIFCETCEALFVLKKSAMRPDFFCITHQSKHSQTLM